MDVGLFLNTMLVVGTDGFVVVKKPPRIKPPRPETPQPPETVDLTGKWVKRGGGYTFTFEGHGEKVELEAEVDGDQLTVTGENLPMVFSRMCDPASCRANRSPRAAKAIPRLGQRD